MWQIFKLSAAILYKTDSGMHIWLLFYCFSFVVWAWKLLFLLTLWVFFVGFYGKILYKTDSGMHIWLLSILSTLFSNFDSDKLRDDVNNEITLICFLIGADLLKLQVVKHIGLFSCTTQ